MYMTHHFFIATYDVQSIDITNGEMCVDSL